MDLTTHYLGLRLAHPFMPGAAPFTDELETVLRLEDAGAAAIVMASLFEEDISRGSTTPDRYLEQLRRIKMRTHLPLIASLNGTTTQGWLRYAVLMERAGADALELNFYHIATDAAESAATVESRVLDIVAVVKESVGIPVAIKLSPFYSSLPHLAAQLDRLGANGLVLFNRFLQPDLDPESLETNLAVSLSDSSELPLRLRWTAILFGRLRASLAITGGVHTSVDAIKAVMAGADAVQIVSAILQHGPRRLREIREQFEGWCDAHGYESLRELRGRMSLARSRDPLAFERGNYVRLLHSWHGGAS